jgi:hypothetical protein
MRLMRSPWIPGGVVLGLAIATWTAPAPANPSDRISGYYVCLNNPAPECRNPDRQVSPGYACLNNPNPDCGNPPRPQTALSPGRWGCLMNQNVLCGNPIRYSVENEETWESRFRHPESLPNEPAP